jgi:hypothetical protein
MGGGYSNLKAVGGVVIWVFTFFKKPFKECLNHKHAFVIGFISVISITYIVILFISLFDKIF